jgi:hypothetical protein
MFEMLMGLVGRMEVDTDGVGVGGIARRDVTNGDLVVRVALSFVFLAIVVVIIPVVISVIILVVSGGRRGLGTFIQARVGVFPFFVSMLEVILAMSMRSMMSMLEVMIPAMSMRSMMSMLEVILAMSMRSMMSMLEVILAMSMRSMMSMLEMILAMLVDLVGHMEVDTDRMGILGIAGRDVTNSDLMARITELSIVIGIVVAKIVVLFRIVVGPKRGGDGLKLVQKEAQHPEADCEPNDLHHRPPPTHTLDLLTGGCKRHVVCYHNDKK